MRTIWCANADSNTNRNCNSDCNSHADSDPYPNAYAYPMHGEMYTDTETASYSSTASVA